MTTINNQDDFLEALRNNPQWRDAVRAQILGEDLLQLPIKFDAFVEEQSAQNKKFDTFVEEQSAQNKKFNTFVEEQSAQNKKFNTFVEEQSAQNKKFNTFVEEQSTRTANLETRVGRIEGDTGTLKGDFARTRAIQDTQGIASDMGLEFVRTLSTTDLSNMSGNALPRDIGRSFRNADLVIEATDGADTRYIAMEVSFTADRRDCDRAIRNAGLITRFTGKWAQAAVASVRNDRDAAEAVESRAVYWHPLEDRTPSPE